MPLETVYVNRDNTIDLALYENNVLINHTTITRVQVLIGSRTLDSYTNPNYFDMTSASKLKLKLGGASLTDGQYKAQLVIYDAVNYNGIVWGELTITVRNGL